MEVSSWDAAIFLTVFAFASNPLLLYSQSKPLLVLISNWTSQLVSCPNSYAFLKAPFFRLANVDQTLKRANQAKIVMNTYRTSLAIVNRLNLDSFSHHTRVVMKVSWISTSLYRKVSAVICGGCGAAQHILPANQKAHLNACTLTSNLFVWQNIEIVDSCLRTV